MKKILLLVSLNFIAGITAFAQNIINPVVERTDDYNCYISKIETTKDYTIVTFDYTAPSDNAWAQVNKEIFIKTNLSDKHYAFVKAEDITIAPEKQYLDHAGDKLTFKVYFQKIPKNAKSIDVIEREGGNTNESSYFNYYNVSLTKSQGKYVTRVDIAPPPASTTSTFSVNSDMANVFNNMGPMFSTMTRSMMDAQLKYYKQPGKIAEIAKLQKEYFDALVEEGFTTDQAMKIITSDSLLPKASVSGK